MYELFLCATVADADLERAKSVLQGLTGMTAWPGHYRVLYFVGPAQPRGLFNKKNLPPQTHPQARSWALLNQQLSRQSFVLQLRYPVEKDIFGDLKPLGPNGPPFSGFDDANGTLRWADIPDPSANPARVIMQRKKLEIQETRKLPTILQENSHEFQDELMEESFLFFTDSIDYDLVRHHKVSESDSVKLGDKAPPANQQPSWPEVAPSAGSGDWLLFVRRHVLEENSPEKMAKGVEELEAVITQLSGVFAFKSIDRRALDTRVERPTGNTVLPMPRKVRV